MLTNGHVPVSAHFLREWETARQAHWEALCVEDEALLEGIDALAVQLTLLASQPPRKLRWGKALRWGSLAGVVWGVVWHLLA